MLQKTTLKFLRDLKENNDKSWMDANRAAFIAAKEDMEQLIEKVIKQLGKTDEQIALLTGKQCMFRQNRDIRFSKNKAPYKINMGASINRGGKKSPYSGYYFHVQPGGESFAGGGMWMPEAPQLKKVRQEIDYCWDEFNKIIHKKAFKDQFGDLDFAAEHTLSREPKGYDGDNPAIKYLKLKSFVALKPLTDDDLTSKDLVKKLTTSFTALQPVIYFINRALEE